MTNPEDPFAVLGLPRRLKTDEALLEKRTLDLNKTWHPDRAGPDLRDEATEKAAAINAAHRALKDLTSRAKTWLSLQGVRLEAARGAPAGALAMRGFEIQEALESFAEAGRDAASLARLSELEAEVAADRKAALELLRRLADEEPEGASPPEAFVSKVAAALTDLNYLDRQAERLASATEDA
jgi:curved DNA-binding protein CbpA